MLADAVLGAHVVAVLLVGDETLAAHLALGHVLFQVPSSVNDQGAFGP